MSSNFFNHEYLEAQGSWDRWTFASRWWRIYSGDPHWAPPYYPRLRSELEPARNSHLVRFDPIYASCVAMPRPVKSRRTMADLSQEAFNSGVMGEAPVAASLVLPELRNREVVAYLAGLRWANDVESLERFIDKLIESLAERGVRRLIGPTGISPHLGSGVLASHWSDTPPLHTPYTPPYMAEQAGLVFEPLEEACLYHLQISDSEPRALAAPANGVNVVPLDIQRLSGDLLKLFGACSLGWSGFAPPDEAEAQFLLRWVCDYPHFAWLALYEGEPAGFIVLQPDLAPILQRWAGGRSLTHRLALKIDLARQARAKAGRLVFGGVLPRLRGKGIGKRLLAHGLLVAHSQGWETVSIGPLPDGSPGAEFLAGHGAVGRQKYVLYQMEIG